MEADSSDIAVQAVEKVSESNWDVLQEIAIGSDHEAAATAAVDKLTRMNGNATHLKTIAQESDHEHAAAKAVEAL